MRTEEGETNVSNAIEGLQPKRVWEYFAEISGIPRGSKNEAAISKHVLETARRLNLQARADKLGNVVVRKPASAGKEGAHRICLQGHLDMVCEKNKETVHDFLKDPIDLVRKGDVLMANGTTLGADNGIAVATNLAIMEDASLVHGPLEFLFTIDEETGLTGASGLGPDFLESRTLINLDSEEEGALYVGCSGGRDTHGFWKLAAEASPKGTVPHLVKVGGLRGGHSGLEIEKNRGNAVKILNRVLIELAGLGGRIASMEGGNKHNAIPREAEAVVYLPKSKWEKAVAEVGAVNRTIKAEVATVEPDLSITIEMQKGSKRGKVLTRALQAKILNTIAALPHGVMKMSSDIPGLVETSTNVAVVKTDRKGITVVTSQRSSVASEILDVCQTVKAVFLLGGATIKQGDGYPGWKPDLASPILQTAKSAYKSLYGKEPEVKAIHAGLECGIIGERYPGMDMVSMGPTLEGVHSPDEKIHIDSVGKYWSFLLEILRRAN
jgi:dipeptidase D